MIRNSSLNRDDGKSDNPSRSRMASQDYIPTEKLLNHILGCISGEISRQPEDAENFRRAWDAF